MQKNLLEVVSTDPLSALYSCRRNHRPAFTAVDCSHQLVSNWMSCLPLDWIGLGLKHLLVLISGG